MSFRDEYDEWLIQNDEEEAERISEAKNAKNDEKDA